MNKDYIKHKIHQGWSAYEFNKWQRQLKSILMELLIKLDKTNNDKAHVYINDFINPPYEEYKLSYDQTLLWIEEWINKSSLAGNKFISDPYIKCHFNDLIFMFTLIEDKYQINISAQIQYKVLGDNCRDTRISALIFCGVDDSCHIIVTTDDQWTQWLGELNGDLPDSYTFFGIYGIEKSDD